MKLLFDENLSRRLVTRLADLFPESSHVVAEGLLQKPDTVVWDHAKARQFAIVTADADFYELSTTFGPPPKVIWLRGCDYPTAVAEGLIRKQAIRIADFLQSQDQGRAGPYAPRHQPLCAMKSQGQTDAFSLLPLLPNARMVMRFSLINHCIYDKMNI